MSSGKGTHNLYLRENRSGKKVWYFDGYVNGRRVRKSLDTAVLSVAKTHRDNLVANKTAHTWGTADRDTPVDEFWQAYLKHSRLHNAKNTVSSDTVKWKQFKDFLKPKTLGSVTRADVERLKEHLQAGRKQKGREQKPRTVNDCLGRLSTMYVFAIEHQYYSGKNPFHGIRRLPVQKLAPKFLDKSQITELLNAAEIGGRDIHLFCSLCVYAGMRSAEAASARWEWFDIDRKIITIQGDASGQFNTKNKKFRTVPLSKKLLAILSPYRRPGGYLLLPDKTERGKWRIRYEPKRAFNTAKTSAGAKQAFFDDNKGKCTAKWVTPHILRHTFASQRAIAGVSLYKIGEWMGHADPKTTKIYAHLAPHDDDIDRMQLVEGAAHE